MVATLLHRRQHTSIEFSCYQYLKDVQHNFPLKKKKKQQIAKYPTMDLTMVQEK